jgi:Alginate export
MSSILDRVDSSVPESCRTHDKILTVSDCSFHPAPGRSMSLRSNTPKTITAFLTTIRITHSPSGGSMRHVVTIAMGARRLDIYYLGIDHKVATFQAGSGREQRESVGVRLADVRGPWDSDSEAIFQFGTFAYRPIRAWTVTSNSGYTIRSSKGQEIDYRLGLDAGIASGNHKPTQGAFGTFNALFPKGAYFGEANFIGPYNIQDIRPSLRVTLPQRRIVIWPNVELLWRQSRQDGIYSIPAVLMQAGHTTNALYVGCQADLNVQWEQNRHLTWAVDGARFFSGAFLRQTKSGMSVNFFAPSVSYRF